MKKNEPIIYDWKSVSVFEAEKQLEALIEAYRVEVTRLVLKTEPCTKKDFQELDELSSKMGKVWSPVAHLKSVDGPRIDKEGQTPEQASRKEFPGKEAYGRCEEKMSAFGTEISQNEDWYRVCKTFAESEEFKTLSVAEKMAINLELRGFRLNGVDLPADKKARCKEINTRLTALSTKFEENMSESSKPENWSLVVTDKKKLKGLSESSIDKAREEAKKQGARWYVFYLGGATYVDIMQNAENRSLRQKFYQAWNTRASDKGSHPEFDNTENIEKILSLSYEKAQLLGFKNHAEKTLVTRMATKEEEVMGFLNGILAKAKNALTDEMAELSAYAKEKDGIEKLERWDVSYYFEQLIKEKYSVSKEEVRKYFPLPKVLDGMFAVVKKLYGISFKERTIPLWHDDAKYFDMYDANGEVTAGIYVDFYERTEGKRSGAWMDEAISRRKLPDESIQVPVGYLTCNFGAPSCDKPALLTMDEVKTLLHEFGHNLQLLLTKIDVSAVSGINGVPWDGVELASQFMENFADTREGVDLLSGHYETGEKIPDELFAKMLRAEKYGSGYVASRQLSLALSDFRLYSEYVPVVTDARKLFVEIQNEIFPMLAVQEYVRQECSFGHIFAGGYSAGYYSYMWADVLAADAFEPFIGKDGAINWGMGKVFLEKFLCHGGSRPFMELYVDYRGRKPTEDALMKKYGFIK